jgi:hypothetical protein
MDDQYQFITMLGTWITALATVGLAFATIALVRTTTRSLKEQTDRAKEAQSTELFLQLRQRAISPEHAARRRRVIALLMYLEERELELNTGKRKLNTGDLEFSPDINLYLNDYEWIGRLVKDRMLTEEYAYSTYGRNLLLLYEKLKPYSENERDKRTGRKNSTLWENVSDLYGTFKRLDKDKLTDEDIKKLLEIERRWLRPATILKPKKDVQQEENSMREEIDVDKVLQDVAAQHQGVLSRHYFKGKDKKRQYYVDYFNFPGDPQDEARNNLALPQFANVAPQLEPFIRKVWPGYSDATVARTIAKFDKFARFALAYHDDKLVAFNVYKVGQVKTKAGSKKTLYVEHAGTHPDYQHNRINYTIRKKFYKKENPDIICGSSANQFIYEANTKLEEELKMKIYPRRDATDPSRLDVPDAIQELAIRIVETLSITNALLDPTRLVRIYDSPVAPSPKPHELQDLLHLDNTMHVFYILVKQELNEDLIRTKKE